LFVLGFCGVLPVVHAMPGCETFCQPNTCRSSPDLASICFETCSEAKACQMAAFSEFRRLHEIHNRSNRGQKPRKDRDGIKRERESKSTESQSDTSSLTSELPTVSLPSESPLPINNEPSVTETPTLNEPIVSTETSQSSLIPPPPPPSDLPAIGKPLVNVGEGGGDLLTQLNNKRGELKKPAEITDPKSTPQGENEATAGKNNMLEALRKAMKDRRGHIDPDDTDASKDNNSPSSDDWGDD